MRWLGRLLLAVLLLGILALAGLSVRTLWPQQDTVASGPELYADASQFRTFVLGDETWLRYQLPPGTLNVRVISNANLLPPEPAADPQTAPEQHVIQSSAQNSAPGLAWEGEYVIHYRLQGEHEAFLLDREYHHRTKRLMYRERSSGAVVPRLYFADGQRIPLAGQRIQLDMHSYPGARVLWLRAGVLPADMADIGVRVYIRTLDQQQQTLQDWQQFSRRKRERIAAPSVFDQSFLEGRERLELMVGQYRPIGPDGERFTERELYARDLALLQPLESPVANVVALQVLHLPKAGRYRLEYDSSATDVTVKPGANEGAAADQAQDKTRVLWRGPDGQMQAFDLASRPLSTERWRAEHDWAAGWLELPAGLQASNVSLALLQHDVYTALPTDPVQTRAYRTDRQDRQTERHALRWPIDHLQGSATPIRLDLRRIFATTEHGLAATAPVDVTYRLLDSSGRSLQSGTIRLDAPPSRYDRMKDAPDLALGQVVKRYWSLDEDVKTLELTSKEPVLGAMFSHIPDLPLMTTVTGVERSTLPAWYVVRPLQWRDMLATGASVLLLLQPEVDAVDEDLLAGRYRWTALEPDKNARGRHLLDPVEAAQDSVREEAFGALFSPIPRNRSFTRRLNAPLRAGRVAPSLIYWRARAEPFAWRLRVDNQQVAQAWAAGHSGTLQLPRITTGRHRFQLDSDARGLWLMNYAQPAPGAYLKRFAQRVTRGKPVRFYVDKPDSQPLVLNLSYYSDSKKGRTSELMVQFHARHTRRKPLPDWSFMQRRYVMTPEPGAPVKVLATAGASVAKPLRGTMRLGEELPAGRYAVTVTLKQGASGYIQLFHIEPGAYEVRELKKLDAVITEE